VLKEPLLRQPRLSRRNCRISEARGRNRAWHGRNRLSLRAGRLDGGGKNRTDECHRGGAGSDAVWECEGSVEDPGKPTSRISGRLTSSQLVGNEADTHIRSHLWLFT